MPELPEVETLRRALSCPWFARSRPLTGRCVFSGKRHPFSHSRRKPSSRELLERQTVENITRRGKYLLLHVQKPAQWSWHLGMSGRIIQRPGSGTRGKTHPCGVPVSSLGHHACISSIPSRFGCIVWAPEKARPPLAGPPGAGPARKPQPPHKALKSPGEKLQEHPSNPFSWTPKRHGGRRQHLRLRIPVRSGLSTPGDRAGKLTLADWEQTAHGACGTTLEASIASGGTTLRDFFSDRRQPPVTTPSIYRCTEKKTSPVPACAPPPSCVSSTPAAPPFSARSARNAEIGFFRSSPSPALYLKCGAGARRGPVSI